MALAKYFSKDLLAITQVLKSGSNDDFQNLLNKTIVGIAFDDAVEKIEGRASLDLTVRLLSRLYPKLKFIDATSKINNLAGEFINLSKAINSNIEIVEDKPSIVIAITDKPISKIITNVPVLYIGSDEWTAKFSVKEPVGSGNSKIPFGAGVSACIGASNIFRHVFKKFLPDAELDKDFSLSLINFQVENVEITPKTESLDVGNFILIGFGAIGNGAVWALANAPQIKGELTIVEPENIDITNLQRYVLAEERHDKKPKVDIAQEHINNSSLKMNVIENDWVYHINNHQWSKECVLVAIDNVKDRIGIQSALPKELINSYTENNLLGISRHFNFGDDACLVCTYMPNEERKSYSQEVSENLGLPQPHMEQQVRNYLFYNKPADEQLLKWIADANAIDYSELEKFIGIPVPEFYAKFVCGGILMELRKDGNKTGTVEAPLAFQSAMAGILLVSEMVINKAGFRKNKLPTKTHFYPLYPVKSGSNPYTHSFPKDSTGRCICSDIDFINAYKSKWSLIS